MGKCTYVQCTQQINVKFQKYYTYLQYKPKQKTIAAPE